MAVRRNLQMYAALGLHFAVKLAWPWERLCEAYRRICMFTVMEGRSGRSPTSCRWLGDQDPCLSRVQQNGNAAIVLGKETRCPDLRKT